jgi:hypothetical protein
MLTERQLITCGHDSDVADIVGSESLIRAWDVRI